LSGKMKFMTDSRYLWWVQSLLGEPSSVEFCHRTGLDYVSCSPFRVPIARLAAAQANLK